MSRRSGGICGVAGAALLVVAGAIGGTPPAPDDSTTAVVTYVVEKRSVLQWQLVLLALAAGFLLWFAATVGAVAAEDGDVDAVHAAVPLAAMAALIAIGFAGALPLTAVAWRGSTSPEVVRLVWDINLLLAPGIALAGALLLGSTAVLHRRSNALPRWLMAAALAGAALDSLAFLTLLARPSSALAPGSAASGLLPILVTVSWIAAVGIALARTDGS